MTDEDKPYIKEVLTKLDIKPTYKLSFIQKEKIDVDNDNQDEIIYCISNYYTEEKTNERFSIVFLVNDNKIEIINKEIVDNDKIYIRKLYSIVGLFDIKDDKKLELLYNSEYSMGNSEDNCLYLYNLASRKQIKNFCE